MLSPSPPGPLIRPLRRRPVPSGAVLPPGLHPVLARVYAARGVASAEDLDLGLGALPSWEGLPGAAEGAALLARALAEDRPVLVVADFDADGATACAVVLRALRAMGARRLGYLVPDRFAHGYGLSPAVARLAAERLGPEGGVVVTVDNGVASVEGVAEARALGLEVVVTDHHLPGERLPEADALVHPALGEPPAHIDAQARVPPRWGGEGFAGRHLAGVGVAFYLMAALRARLRAEGWFARRGLPEPRLDRLLDLVALGTVADVVPLDRVNRILVAQGLGRIRARRASPGVLALLEAAGRDPREAVAADLGYGAAPRLNAAGRLADMGQGIACLLAGEASAARALAAELDRLNRERRRLLGRMQAEALEALRGLELEGEGPPPALCLYRPGWHQGLVGLVAGRVKDRLHRPTVAFAEAGEGMLKGSARSVPGLHLRDALAAVAARRPGLLAAFGGHAQAAGLLLARRDLEAFREAFAEEVARRLDAEALRGVVDSDGPLEARDLAGPGALALAEGLRRGGPWGQAFPEPLFDGPFQVLERRSLAGGHLRLRLRHPEGPELEAVAFHPVAEALQAEGGPGAERPHLAYRLAVDRFRGRRRVRLMVEHRVAEPWAAGPAEPG